MLVAINNHGAGVCAWCCQKTDDSVEADFKDGLSGTFCKKHFWEALRKRSGKRPHEDPRPAMKGTPST